MTSKNTHVKPDRDVIYKKALGSLLGVALGDSFGMPTSLWPPEMVHKYFPDGVNELLPAPKGHVIHNGLVAGQVTDDTQQTMILAELFIETGQFDRNGAAQKLLKWAKSLNAFANSLLGPSSLKALKAIEAGTPVELTGTQGDTNGAAMRIAPAGIVHPGDYDAVIKDVEEICIPTHYTNIAIAGASAVACAVSAGMAGKDMNAVIEAYMYGAEQGMKLGNIWYGASIVKRTEMALDIVRSGKQEKEIWQDLYDYVGAGVAMTEAAPTSLALVVMYNGNPLKTAYASANMGGDCDTIGAIAGGMAGAFSGADIFPEKTIELLSKVNNLDFRGYAAKMADIIVNK
jgi:ADP-ribosylglycohydrolase